MENLWAALKLFAAIAGMSAIIPLMVWGGSGSWRHGLHAWKSWAKVMGAFLTIGGGFGILAILNEAGFSGLWAWITH